MKHIYSRSLAILLILFSVSATYAQHYYVIVGAFAIESNAMKFTGYVRSQHYNGAYELYTAKNIFYVYVMKSDNHDEAIQLVKNLQTESEFKDAWAFKGVLGNEAEVKQLVIEITQPIVQNKDSAEQFAEKIIMDKPVPPEVLEPAIDSMTIKQEPIKEPSADVANSIDNTAATEAIPMVIKGKLFRFAIETPDGKPLHAEVHQVDFRLGKDVATFKGNQYIDVLNPMRNNPMTIVCGVFGYKEVVKEIDYTDPASTPGVSKDSQGAWVIPYKLERMKNGDISVMYHLSFYKDAVVMTPGSKPEMDELVNMMKDNPNYKIKIHGHCNGANARRIIAVGETKNYFDVKGSNEIKGSAKELSKQRAEAVQNYLADNGIDKNRTDVHAWGALNMLVDEHSNSARLNDRIEIEITAD